MDVGRLIETAQALVAGDRGLLALDESTPTCDKRCAKLGIPCSEEMRRAYRDMIVTTPGFGRCISGAIFCDETIRCRTLASVPFAQADAHALARYAALCQEADLVPIVDPEVLMDGDHALEPLPRGHRRDAARGLRRARRAARAARRHAAEAARRRRCRPGQRRCGRRRDSRVLPALRAGRVPGIAFLSGGQSARLASAHLDAMNVRFGSKVPWRLAFSFARAIQQPALEIWCGDGGNAAAAQQALFHRADCNRAARRGEYGPAAAAPRPA
jgi:fructose-bisphosphate aldolase class 1